jgi:prepilin-type N-terminal cleavage/methylation domain-containing protein
MDMNVLHKSEKGFTLVEVLITITLLGFIALAFFSFMSAAASSLIHADERTIAESLARSQLEYAKNQGYQDPTSAGEATYEKIPSINIPPGYTIESINRGGEPVEGIVGIVWDNTNDHNRPMVPATTDTGLQMVSLVIEHEGRLIGIFTNSNPDWANGREMTLQGYIRASDT